MNNKTPLFMFPVGGRGDFLSSVIYGNKLSRSYNQDEVSWPDNDPPKKFMKAHQWGDCEYSGKLITPDLLIDPSVESWIVTTPTFKEVFETAYLNWYKKFKVDQTVDPKKLNALVHLTKQFNDNVGKHKNLFTYNIEFSNLFDINYLQQLYQKINQVDISSADLENIKYNIELNQKILQTCPFMWDNWETFFDTIDETQTFFCK